MIQVGGKQRVIGIRRRAARSGKSFGRDPARVLDRRSCGDAGLAVWKAEHKPIDDVLIDRRRPAALPANSLNLPSRLM